jgi:hypothetical protein
MKPRLLKPFTELQRLSDDDLAQLWSDLHTGLTYSRAIHILAKEHFIYIRRHRLFRWWHLESDRRQLNTNLPGEFKLTAAQFFDLLNAQSLPWADLMHTRILQAGYILSCGDDQTPSRLLTLQRIANNPFHQQIARDKLALATRTQNFREQTAAAKSRDNDPQRSLDEALDEFLGPSRVRTEETEPPSVAAPRQSAQTSNPTHRAPNNRPDETAPPQCQIKNAQCTLLNELPLQASPSTSNLAARSSSLTHRVNAYTLARHDEALHRRNPAKRHHFASPYKTDLHHCPCGEKVLPCPHHGDFPSVFWETTPDSADYIQVLHGKNLPYTAPALLLQERDREQRRAAALKTAPSPEALLRSATSHAIRRWRSYTPRPPGSPPPDESWTEECPCGAPHPCDLHPDLWSEVRYIRPSDPDYAAALRRNDIPVYTPTPSDLTPNPNPNQANDSSSKTLSPTRSPASTSAANTTSPSVGSSSASPPWVLQPASLSRPLSTVRCPVRVPSAAQSECHDHPGGEYGFKIRIEAVNQAVVRSSRSPLESSA